MTLGFCIRIDNKLIKRMVYAFALFNASQGVIMAVHWAAMNIIKMPVKIPLVAPKMLPKPPLPNPPARRTARHHTPLAAH